jgi:hypothetical protein
MRTNQCQFEPYSTTSSLQICKWCHRLKGEHDKDIMSNKKKQNSIDWLVEELRKYIEEPWKYVPKGGKEAIVEQAKAMHKEEIETAMRVAFIDGLRSDDVNYKSPYQVWEQYYNETYGGNK